MKSTKINVANFEKIEALGCEWEKYGKHRLYLKAEACLKALGFSWDRYKTGSISSARDANGEAISNGKMSKNFSAFEKSYIDLKTGELFLGTAGTYGLEDDLVALLDSMVEEKVEEVEEVTAEEVEEVAAEEVEEVKAEEVEEVTAEEVEEVAAPADTDKEEKAEEVDAPADASEAVEEVKEVKVEGTGRGFRPRIDLEALYSDLEEGGPRSRVGVSKSGDFALLWEVLGDFGAVMVRTFSDGVATWSTRGTAYGLKDAKAHTMQDLAELAERVYQKQKK